jgi:nucleoside 2-deoxyribosyltransferase
MSHSAPRVYLAGPIKGCSYDGATDWRDDARRSLRTAGIEGMSPMRGKDYLKGHAKVGQDELLKDSYDQYPLSTNAAILCRDHRDCTTCDAVIVYLLGAKRVSIGTVMEVAWSHHARVPVIVVIEKDGSNVHEHGLMLQACNFRVDNLAEAVAVAKAVLLP